MDLLNKIKPQSLKDVIGNRIQISNFLKYLKDETPENNIILLTGPNGCGKSLICELSIKELDLDPLNINKTNLTIKEIINLVTTFLSNRTISSFFEKKRKIIFMDNIDIMISIDKSIISLLSDIYPILKKFNVLLLITCKNNEERKILELKNMVEIVKINYPTIKDAFAYLSNIISENEIEISEDDLIQMVNKYKGSIRDIIMNMYVNDIEYSDLSSFKDMTQFEIIKKVYRKKHTFQEIMSLLRDDVSIVSYLMYENFPDELHANCDFKASKILLIDTYIKLNNLYLTSSIFEDFMFSNADWSLYNLTQLLKIQGMNIVIHEIKKKPTQKDVKYRFSQVTSKLSHKNIMNKKVKQINKTNKSMNVIDSILFADIIAKDPTTCTSGVRKKKKFDLDECNFINTYQKYFE